MNKKKAILKRYLGKGGLEQTSFSQADSPINLLENPGIPPTATAIPKSKSNSLGN